MKNLWKVTVNNWEWNSPRDIYAESREDALNKARQYPAYDMPVYAGRFTEKNAAALLQPESVNE